MRKPNFSCRWDWELYRLRVGTINFRNVSLTGAEGGVGYENKTNLDRQYWGSEFQIESLKKTKNTSKMLCLLLDWTKHRCSSTKNMCTRTSTDVPPTHCQKMKKTKCVLSWVRLTSQICPFRDKKPPQGGLTQPFEGRIPRKIIYTHWSQATWKKSQGFKSERLRRR
jgi:hypothetical protein